MKASLVCFAMLMFPSSKVPYGNRIPTSLSTSGGPRPGTPSADSIGLPLSQISRPAGLHGRHRSRDTIAARVNVAAVGILRRRQGHCERVECIGRAGIYPRSLCLRHSELATDTDFLPLLGNISSTSGSRPLWKIDSEDSASLGG
ncbi:hypothetical protein OH76DRAFT_335353 [Lentinus brumalis]|uniref:Uncharacterized protein n=1 Tax=Lentinus brumalis TaxID=2498619 RepID=A0A371CJQ5_9APHY|nr:hypothetical protein OH76DRAFT_335353 [Polyporus brumalis]